jgi:quercetin dioxygenase-like cupin family protein
MKSKHFFSTILTTGLLLAIAVLFTGCTGKTTGQPNQTASRNITSPEALPFPLGQATENLALFNGTVYLTDLVSNEEVFNSPAMAHVIFPPGIINKWHIHTNGQILIATAGIGYHQLEGEPIQVMYPGDVAHCPPGVKHWHGATPDSWFAHIAIATNPQMRGLEIFDFISEAEYLALPRE